MGAVGSSVGLNVGAGVGGKYTVTVSVNVQYGCSTTVSEVVVTA